MGATRRAYPLHQCALFKVSSPRQLATRLQIDLVELERLACGTTNYNIWEEKKSNGKSRTIQEPKRRLQMVQKRVHDLLSRVEAPAYLHSAIKGKSYLTNARAHSGKDAIVKVDVRAFFQSVKKVSVFQFFRDHLRCAPDVCGLMANLLTINGHLPTGSSSSPIISYYAHKNMFDEINKLATSHRLVMTCYVDDMALSGPYAGRGILFKVRKIIARSGLSSHKAHYFPPNRPKVITGIVLTSGGLNLPNRRHRKIAEEYRAYLEAPTKQDKLTILQRLISRLHEAAAINPTVWLPRARALIAERRLLKAATHGDTKQPMGATGDRTAL